MTLTGDLKKMGGDEGNVQMTHKGESVSCITLDGCDCKSLCQGLESTIDPMDTATPAGGCLLNIATGKVAQWNINVDRALEIEPEQLHQFEASWLEDFHSALSKQVIIFSEKDEKLTVDKTAIIDQEAIYAQMNGLLVSVT